MNNVVVNCSSSVNFLFINFPSQDAHSKFTSLIPPLPPTLFGDCWKDLEGARDALDSSISAISEGEENGKICKTNKQKKSPKSTLLADNTREDNKTNKA